jgi:hypothetical protein
MVRNKSSYLKKKKKKLPILNVTKTLICILQ